MRAVVEALQALRGVAQITAVTIVAELGTLSRFQTPRQLMGYSGLVASEFSSGNRIQRGGITKTGNAHLRRVLVESAWVYQHRPWIGGFLLQRQQGLDQEVKHIAWKAQWRLHTRYKKLSAAGKKKPQIVTESMREFSKDRYGVDVLKVEVPVNMKFVEGTKSFGGTKAYTKKEAIDLFHKAANVATKPFIYLSAGVSNAEFSETLELAGESGVKFNGVLCGRATWKDGIPVYAKHGAAAFRKWLETEGVKNINNVNSKLKAATSWHSIYGVELVHA